MPYGGGALFFLFGGEMAAFSDACRRSLVKKYCCIALVVGNIKCCVDALSSVRSRAYHTSALAVGINNVCTYCIVSLSLFLHSKEYTLVVLSAV